MGICRMRVVRMAMLRYTAATLMDTSGFTMMLSLGGGNAGVRPITGVLGSPGTCRVNRSRRAMLAS
ncbi:MAG: hypothetical protein EBY57_11785 [Actinobacteria bacterium]|nr:hypothetical protein [Actinomycetota bacterium]